MRRRHCPDTNQPNSEIVPIGCLICPKFEFFEDGFSSTPPYSCQLRCGPYISNSSSYRIISGRISSLLRLATIWMVAMSPHASAAGNGSVANSRQRQGERFYSSCPFDKLDGCFRRAFMTMSDPNDAMANCDDYERLASCFRYVNCSEKETSEIGARVFFMTKKVRLPKEFFNALMTRWRLRCSLECTDYEPEECRRTMLSREQDADHALLMEMQSLKMQMTLLAGASSQKDTCGSYRRAMYRWHIFRLDKCSNGDSTCYCKREERRLRPICNVQCDKLHLTNGRNDATRAYVKILVYPFLWVLQIFVCLLLCYLGQ